jgi:hypothetical protein
MILWIFFSSETHWAYQYGDRTPDCNPNSPYHRKQIEILFEGKYDHWDTNAAVDNLVLNGFLKIKPYGKANFVFKAEMRYYLREVKRRARIIEAYSNPTITAAVGNWGERLVEYMFLLNGFEILARNANRFRGKTWTNTNENLDFIIG